MKPKHYPYSGKPKVVESVTYYAENEPYFVLSLDAHKLASQTYTRKFIGKDSV